MPGRPRTCTHDGCHNRTVARRLCRTHYQAAWHAGLLGDHAKLPTRPRHRIVCPPNHKHEASSTCYIQHQCRCDPCTDHHTAMQRRRDRLKAYGRFDTGLVDAEPVREHLLMLGEHGLGYKRIAGLAGLGVTPVRTILWGRQDPGPRKGELPKRVKRETAERILAVRPSLDLLGDRTLVSARPYIRRIRALIAAGWTQRELGVRLGCGTNLCTTLASYERQRRRNRTYQITAARARAIVALYDELNLIRPTGVAADRSRAYAAARGWPDPWAWEVYDNDFDRPSPPFAKASTA